MSRRLTRRAMLERAAAAGLVPLAHPSLALGRAGPRVFSQAIGSVTGATGPVRAPALFALLGLEWERPSGARIELRVLRPDGSWSAWASASVQGHDGDGRAAPSRFGEPIWSGPARVFELRSAERIDGARVHFVAPRRASPAAAAGSFPLASPRLDAGPGQPPIIARRAWGQGQAPVKNGPFYGAVKLGFVHHTVNLNGYTPSDVPGMLLNIYDYHVSTRGFWDIAYNFIIDAFGRIWEARAGGIDVAVVGAHAGAYNQESTGVAMLGTFMSVVPPSPAMVALERLLAWKLSLHGVPTSGRVTVVVSPSDYFYTPFAPGQHVSLPRIAGHRDGDSTDCPGDALYGQLPAVRARARSLAGHPARVTLRAPGSPVRRGAPVAVSGRLTTIAGAPIAGAPVEVQMVVPRRLTLATATTAANGSWAARIELHRDALIRALHRPYPATGSRLLTLTVRS